MHNSTSVRLKIFIESTGLNLKAFSHKAGVPYRTVQSYLSGDNVPGGDNLQKISATFCVNLNWLLTGEGDMIRQPAPGEIDDVTQKVLTLLKDMDEGKRRDVLKYIEEKKLLTELLEERKKLKGAG